MKSSPPQIGNRTIAGRYRLINELGRGGMGIVYAARDERLGRLVAIKALNDTLSSNAEARDLFLQEGRQLATLSHPNLVAIYDVTTEDGQDLLISEFVDGQNLDELLTEGPLDLATALSVAIQMCEGIAFLHEQGVIHRDIKPANVMLKPDGSIKIIDFGLARSLDQILQKGTQMRGTPAYMAPEQLFGPGPTEATDIYQLAVTFYELFTAKFPFDLNPKAAWAHLNNPVCTPLTERIADFPPQLSHTIQACIAREPTARPTLPDLLASLAKTYAATPHATLIPLSGKTSRLLEALRADEPQPQPPETPPTTNPKSLFALLAAIITAILLALGIVYFIVTQPPPTPQTMAESPVMDQQDPQPEKPAPEAPHNQEEAQIQAQEQAHQQATQSILNGLNTASIQAETQANTKTPQDTASPTKPAAELRRKPTPKDARPVISAPTKPLTPKPLPVEPQPTTEPQPKADPSPVTPRKPIPYPRKRETPPQELPSPKTTPSPAVEPEKTKDSDKKKESEKTKESKPKPAPEVPRFF